MHSEVIQRLVAEMQESGLDALLIVSPENFAYVTGFVVPSQPLMRWRHAAFLLCADGQTAAMCVDMEETTLRSKLSNIELAVWGEFTDDPMEVLAALLREKGLARARIGTEMDYFPAGDFARLGAAIPQADLSASEALLARARQIKTPAEIALMREISRISDRSILQSFEAVEAGKSEMDIAGTLTRSVFENGGEDFKLMIVATGERSVLPNVGPSERILKPGDICRVEIFAMKQGYHAGVCRTAFVERPPDHAVEIWKNLDECKHIVLDMIKPGASSKAIYEAFLKQLSKLDLPPIKFVGHGIGLHLHEDPYLGMYSDVPLEAGMVLGIEPLVYNTGYGFGMQNKDIVAVTDRGAELLSNVTDTTDLIRIG